MNDSAKWMVFAANVHTGNMCIGKVKNQSEFFRFTWSSEARSTTSSPYQKKLQLEIGIYMLLDKLHINELNWKPLSICNRKSKLKIVSDYLISQILPESSCMPVAATS